MHKCGKIILRLIIPAVLFSTWMLFCSVKADKLSYVISPAQIFSGIIEHRDVIITNSLISLKRLIIGVLLGGACGCAVGFFMERIYVIRILLFPTIKFFGALPFIAIIPLFLIFFGLNEHFIYAIVAMMSFTIVAPQVFSATYNMPSQYIDIAKMHQKSMLSIIMKIHLPAALPAIIRSLKLSFIFGWLAILLAEQTVGKVDKGGLGIFIMNARSYGNFYMMFTGVASLIILAFAIDLILSRLERKVSSWEKSIGQNELQKTRGIL